jgi:hypothetical protein
LHLRLLNLNGQAFPPLVRHPKRNDGSLFVRNEKQREVLRVNPALRWRLTIVRTSAFPYYSKLRNTRPQEKRREFLRRLARDDHERRKQKKKIGRTGHAPHGPYDRFSAASFAREKSPIICKRATDASSCFTLFHPARDAAQHATNLAKKIRGELNAQAR